jgi:hypothetical protein
MPTKRSVADIKSNLLRPALTSHFEVQIPVPTKMKERVNNKKSFLEYNGISLSAGQQDKLNLLCSEASLPGSSLATIEINNDYTGVTERHAYRRIYDDRIDLTFYVDVNNYLPIRFFETWIKFIVDESIGPQDDRGNLGSMSPSYHYKIRYPEEYVATGLKVIKFERDYVGSLEYEFINAFPISVSSMPVSYDSSSLLKCTVSLTYIRYVLKQGSESPVNDPNPKTPEQQAYINNTIYTSESTGPQSTLGQIFQNR